MAVLLTRDWTGADGVSWETVGFRRIFGAAVDATVLSNEGRCGVSAAERAFALTGWTQTTGHKLACDMRWNAAGSQSRVPGVGLRWTEDGDNGYLGEVDSNTGSARVRIRRRRGGSWTDLTGWVAVSGAPFSISAAALNAGVTVELRAVNGDEQVELQLTVAGQVVATHDDTDADRLEDAGLAVVWLDGLSSTGDVTYDDAIVRDLEDEYAGDAADLEVGIALVVDGVSYSWDDLVDADVVVGRGGTSYSDGDAWTFFQPALMDAADGILYPGAVVKVALDGQIVASGRLRASRRQLRPGEGRTYELVGSARLAAEVMLEAPTTHAPTMVWNLPPEHADYDASRSGKTVGEAIAEVLDEHADGRTGLRAHLAGPADESVPMYDQTELDAITVEVTGMSASQDPWSAVQQLLGLTKYVARIDPGTLQWRFESRTGGDIEQVDLSEDHVLGEFTIDPERNFTAAVAQGEKPEAVEQTVVFDPSTPGGGLEKQWPAALEATTSAEKRVRNRATGLVQSVSGSGSAPTMTPDPSGPPAFSMEALEWVKGTVGFLDGAEAGETYDVTTNTSGSFTLAGPWRNGGPSGGDEFVVSGNAVGGGRDNAHTEIGRRFKLDDLDLGIPDDSCVRVTLIKDGIQKITTAKVVTPDDASEPAEVVLDLPAIGLVNFTPEAHTSPCEAGGATDLARVEIPLRTYSRSDPRVPRRWFPRDGSGEDAYRGTAFTADSAKWDGAGQPGKGDPAVMVPYRLNVPEYDGSAAQAAALDAAMAEILEYLSPLAMGVQLEISGLDLRFAALGCRLQVLGGPAELEAIETLTVRAVEYDPGANKTYVYAGTLASGAFDIQQMRQAVLEKHLKRTSRKDQAASQRFLDCLTQNLHSAGYAREAAPTQTCGQQVTTDATKPQRSAKEDLDVLVLWLEWLAGWIYVQKGYLIEIDPENGRITVTLPDGTEVHSDDNGETWQEEDGDPAPNPLPTDPEDLGDGSIEGKLRDLIKDILANLGKTTDADPEEPNQLVAPPNLTLPGGGTFHSPGGSFPPIPPGGKAPGSIPGTLEANKKAEGLGVHTHDDPIGSVFEMPGGELFIARPPGAETGYGNTRFIEVEAAGGGAGTGENDGDFDIVASDPVTPLPRVHLEAQELDGSGVLDGTDGYGRSLPDGGTTTGTTEPLTLPATAEGYDGQKGIKVAVTVRAEGASGDGDAQLQVSARYVPPGADPTAVSYTTIVAAGPVALLADGSTAVVEGTLDVNSAGTSNGGYVQVRVTRDGAHASDTLPGRVNVLGVGVDAACTSIFVPVENHA